MESIAAFLGSGCSSRETEIMNEVLSRWARDTSRGACLDWIIRALLVALLHLTLMLFSQNGVLVVVVVVVGVGVPVVEVEVLTLSMP